MRIGVGLPTSTPPLGARHRGPELLAWATEAEAGPFTSLGVTDRLVYDCTDPMVALAAAAAVTTRLRLVTMVVIGPIRPAAVLAAQAASLDALVGRAGHARRVARRPARRLRRRRRRRGGAGGSSCPTSWPPCGRSGREPPSAPGRRRAAGRTCWSAAAAAQPSCGRPATPTATSTAEGRPGRSPAPPTGPGRRGPTPAGPVRPQLWGQSYFSLADPDAGAAYLRHYYAFTGPFAERVAAGLLDSPKAVREHVAGYADAGCDELVLLPATSDPSELDRLADALA